MSRLFGYIDEFSNCIDKRCNFKNIKIYTDSKFVCNVMDINGYPEFDYYYKLLEKIFESMNILSKYNIWIEIIKIPSHSGINGNTIADTLANKAADQSRANKFKGNASVKYNQYNNPVNVDISKDLINLRKNIINKNELINGKIDMIDGVHLSLIKIFFKVV